MKFKKILVFDISPVFKDHVHGGSEKVLREVAIYLGARGHTVNIFCVSREDNNKPFKLSKNVQVNPVLKFKQTFPSAYKTSPYNLWKIIETLKYQIGKHDVFYSHGSGLNFAEIYNQRIPTIISLRDFVYPETLVGAFNFKRDVMIVNSKTVMESVANSIGNFLPGINKRIKLIPNGINLKLFKKTKPKKIYDLLEKKLHLKDIVILFPHRPEQSKGIFQSLEILSRLKHKHKMRNIKLLIPRYLDEKISNETKDYYSSLYEKIKEKRLENNVIFHKWVPYEMMPEYYSLGHLTLLIGNFIEAFGSNVAIESLACGTPVIVSKVGAQKTTLPDNLIPKVSYGNLYEIENLSIKFIKEKSKYFNENNIREYLKNNFSHKKMLEAYEQIICTTKILKPLKLKIKRLNINKSNFCISPWCCLTEFGLYNDYEYGYQNITKKLKDMLQKNKKVNLKMAKEKKLQREFLNLINKGILIQKK